MVAPLDAKVTFEVEGETITLRLNGRTVGLAEENGIDLLGGTMTELSPHKAAVLATCLMVQEHPDYTIDHAIAIIAMEPRGFRDALLKLFEKYGGILEGNRKGRKAKLKTAA